MFSCLFVVGTDGAKGLSQKGMKMANEDNPNQVGTETKVPFDDLCVEEIQQLKIVRVKSVREGAGPSCSYHFSPSTRGLPDDFLCMDGITWKSCDEAALSRTVRNWVQHLRGEGGSRGAVLVPRRNLALPSELSRRTYRLVVQCLDLDDGCHRYRRQDP